MNSPARLAAALLVAALLATACEAGDAQPRRLFKPAGTPTPIPTPTLSAGERDALLDEGVARPDVGFFIRQPAGWGTDPVTRDDVAVRFANTVADSDATGEIFASLLVGFDEIAPPARDELTGYLQATVDDAPERLSSQFEGFALIEAAVQTGGRTPLAVVEFTYQNASGTRLHAIRALAPADRRVFVIAATTLDSAWPAYQRAIRASLASFTLLGE